MVVSNALEASPPRINPDRHFEPQGSSRADDSTDADRAMRHGVSRIA
jgi:hypothetical protein